jgi:ABC-2 type transport system ATP-binding protein
MIELQDFIKRYNGVTVLAVPHLTILPGETFGLVGNNGAGKTTLFCLVLDLIIPETGRVYSNGREVRSCDD